MTNFDCKVFGIACAGVGEPGEVGEMGFKAFNLARMSRAGLPVPPAIVFGTDCCRAFAATPEPARFALRRALSDHLPALERACGLGFGAGRRPLLVSVRSGAPVSMPGMMDTVLNIGLNAATLPGFLRLTGNPRLVWDSYRRLIEQFAEVAGGADTEPFRAAAREEIARAGVERLQDLDFESLRRLAAANLEIYRGLFRQPFPQDPMEQLAQATEAVFASWGSERAVEYRRLQGIDDGLGTAATVQRMVFGNAGGLSGSGVGFTRDPATGENRLFFDFLFNSQGEDVVSGRYAAADAGRLPAVLPAVARQLEDLRAALEGEFGDMQEFEFTVSDGKLFLLQTRDGKRTPWAALRIAVERVQAGEIDVEAAERQLAGIDLQHLERRRLVADVGADLLAAAEPASMGVACGPIALDVAAARRLAAAGPAPILVRTDAATADIGGLALAAGLLTASGGRTAHAAVVARQLGKVCLVDCRSLRLDLDRRTASFGERTLAEGETVTLDANDGRVIAGAPKFEVERPLALLAALDKWRHAHGRRRTPAL